MVEATTLPLMWSWRNPDSLSVTATDAFTLLLDVEIPLDRVPPLDVAAERDEPVRCAGHRPHAGQGRDDDEPGTPRGSEPHATHRLPRGTGPMLPVLPRLEAAARRRQERQHRGDSRHQRQREARPPAQRRRTHRQRAAGDVIDEEERPRRVHPRKKVLTDLPERDLIPDHVGAIRERRQEGELTPPQRQVGSVGALRQPGTTQTAGPDAGQEHRQNQRKVVHGGAEQQQQLAGPYHLGPKRGTAGEPDRRQHQVSRGHRPRFGHVRCRRTWVGGPRATAPRALPRRSDRPPPGSSPPYRAGAGDRSRR